MSDIPVCLFHYLDAWNEPDPALVRPHLEKSCAANVLFVDPAHVTRDIEGLEAMIVRARRDERPTASYHRTTGVDGHNLRYRYLWEVRIDGTPVLPGMDVTTLNEEGQIVQIDGFFGEFPTLGD